MVTVGGTEPQQQQTHPAPSARRAGAVGAAGLVAGLVLGGLFTGSAPDRETVPEEMTTAVGVEPPGAAPVPTTTTIPVPVRRLATQVPGVFDTLVMELAEPTGIDRVVVWPAAGIDPDPSSLPGGDFATSASGQWISVLSANRYTAHESLWVGNAAYAEPISTSATGSVWHARFPGRIAWTEQTDSTVLLTLDLQAGGEGVPRALGPVGDAERPVWWHDDEGIILWNPEALTLRLVDDTGETVADIADVNRFLGAGGDRAFVLSGERIVVVNPVLEITGTAPWDPACTSATGQPLIGANVAVDCSTSEGTSLQVWNLEEQPWLLIHDIPVHGSHEAVWTPNGRFAVRASTDPVRPGTELVFVDLLTGDVTGVPVAGRALDVVVVRG